MLLKMKGGEKDGAYLGVLCRSNVKQRRSMEHRKGEKTFVSVLLLCYFKM